LRRSSARLRIPLLAVLLFGTLSGPLEGGSSAGITAPGSGPGMSTVGQGVLRAVAARAYQRGTISGRVVLPTGPSVNNRIRVTLSGPRVTSVTAYTDNKGRFVFGNVSDGTYTLEVTADSTVYEPVTQEVRLIYGAHPGLIITLKEKAGAARTSNANIISTSEVDQNVPDAAKKEFEKGARLSDKGKIEDAIECFRKAIAIYPTYLMAINNLGVQYLKLGKWPEAVERFQAAIQVDVKAFSPRLNLAIALIEQKKYAEAVEDLYQAISLDSSSPGAHLYLGIASLGTEEVDQAERELSTALSLGGNSYSLAHFYLALAHMKRGERQQAISSLNAYLEKMPKGDKAPRARQLLEKLKQ
jgi:Flp pilus assembly protein TadD